MQRSKKAVWRLLLMSLPMLLFAGCHDHTHDDPYNEFGPNTLIIRNDDAAYGAILYAYVAPSSSGTWGEDLLGKEVLYPGEELIADVYDCDRYYDLLVEYDHGLVVEKDGIWLPCDTTMIVSFID